ncbi:MAG TPA: hypothetical protein VJZ71_01380 [Phycisphaerae bacterium]|nr:hypothetical protein [Phycisphaerae bacterium]
MDQTLEPITQLFLNIFPQPFFLTMLDVIAVVFEAIFGFFGLNVGFVAV